MTPLWFSHLLILLALIVGSITDFKKREVPDFLNFSLMGIGVVLALLNSIATNDFFFLLGSIIGLVSGYLLGALMFYTGQWGGGDAKMLMGIGAIIGIDIRYFWQPGVELPLFFTVVLSIFIAGTIYGLGYGIYLLYTHRKEFKKAFLARIREPSIIKVRVGIIAAVLALIGSAIFTSDFYLRWIFAFLALVVFGGFYLVIVGKLIEKVCMIRPLAVGELTEGEWIAQEVIVKGKRICGPKDLGISNEQIAQLKKLKVKTVIIKEGIPFIPGFLLGYIFIILVGNWLIPLISLF
ncbi:MAG: prepilin peptidase [Nanoarchaeota archaeon]|nr:prepilin peptidase [Nanoarchaeota archaeon]